MRLKQVLVIDDSDPDLLYAEVILDKAGIATKVTTFGTALEALEFLQGSEGREAEVILLDINMPEMNGFEFLDAYQDLLAEGQTRAVVVLLTSSPDPSDQARAMSYACVKGYIVKPLDVPRAKGLSNLVAQRGDTND